MADYSVVDNDKSKIVTKFLFNTCRLRQPTKHHVHSTMYSCAQATGHPGSDDEAEMIPLTSGSVGEFYIQPMLSCVGDIDVMRHRNTELAIPAGHPPPTQLPAEFHSRIRVHEIVDSEYPGYVYLMVSYFLKENTDADKYEADQRPCRRQYVFYDMHALRTGREINGPAFKLQYASMPLDDVQCVRCLSWPTQAADWPTRQRNYDWPDSATVDRVVSNGCDVVCTSHPLSRENEWMKKCQRRLSFSRAEIVLLNSWIPVQQIVYHMLRFFVKNERLTDITDSSGTKILSNYHIKTLMLWACELKPRSWWVVDLNAVRICVDLLHTLADWMKEKIFPHYFVICNLGLIDPSFQAELIVSQLMSITESSLSTWFVDSYLRKCAQLCPDSVSVLFDDVSTSIKLQNAVSAVTECRVKSLQQDDISLMILSPFTMLSTVATHSLTVHSCDCWMKELPKIDSCLCVYFNAIAFLHVAFRTSRNGLSDELIDILLTLVEQFVGKRRYPKQFSSVFSLRQATKLMKVVANNSRSTLQLIEIELSKAYLYRALRCKDSDSDSIYCLASVYLALLYYNTGHYQTAIDHCTLVTGLQDHSQCSSHVVQGELLPKIDDEIDTALGLAVYYQYVRTAALNQQRTHRVSVFNAELFAHYLHMRCLSVTKCFQFTQKSLTEDVQQCIIAVVNCALPFIADVLSVKLTEILKGKRYRRRVTKYRRKLPVKAEEQDATELIKLLQQSAVEHLTTYRQLQAQKLWSAPTIVTTDFEALYAYKRGDYELCLQLSTQNVLTLLKADMLYADITIYPKFIQLFDDELVALTALMMVVDTRFRNWTFGCAVTQLTLSLYLMTQCRLNLHHSATSLAETLDYIEVARSKYPFDMTLNNLTLKLIKSKIIIYLISIM